MTGASTVKHFNTRATAFQQSSAVNCLNVHAHAVLTMITSRLTTNNSCTCDIGANLMWIGENKSKWDPPSEFTFVSHHVSLKRLDAAAVVRFAFQAGRW